jgi:5-methylcytosine-specific restriction endonuclease McrA
MRAIEAPRLPPLDACPALVLNADYRPLSYFPLSTWNWQETIKAIFLDRVAVLSHYDRVVHSPSTAFQLPSVVALKQYIPQNRRPPFTRFNVFLRDGFSCQYCGHGEQASELTFDHVVPRSRGGRTSWDNVGAACTRCNLSKGNQLPRECGMRPLTVPGMPTTFQLQERGRSFPPNFLHESWRDFLYWDSELEP